MIIGQKALLERLNSYNIRSFPRTVLLIGEQGSGKHTIVNYIQENIVRYPLIDITETVSGELIDNIYTAPSPNIFMLDLSKITEREQNICLKIIEEPSNNAFVILLAETVNSVLPTVYNRCVAFNMDLYTDDELMNFMPESALSNKELVLSIYRTPGKLKSVNVNNLLGLTDLCNTIAEKIDKAAYQNTLTIKNKLNYKDNFDKPDIQAFFTVLLKSLFEYYKESKDLKYYKMYELTQSTYKKLIDTRLNKELLVENYLSKLWQLAKEYHGN